MTGIQKYAILLSFLGLWLTSFLTAGYQTVVGLGLIFSFGILHGANDLKLIDKIEQNSRIPFLKILTAYLILILVTVILFMKMPVLALLIFIVVSAYHFGEQNWQQLLKKISRLKSGFFQFSYGLLILSALFYFNEVEVEKIIFKITSVQIYSSYFQIVLLISTLIYILTSLLIIKSQNDLTEKVIEQSLYIILLCVIFKVASLILGFAIYFIFWHSIPSIYEQITFLYGSYNFTNFKKYFKAAFWYWIVSLLGISVLYYVSKDLIFFDALFFSFLASVTFPHFIVIIVMYSRKKKENHSL
jgi:Brp/Blh family beta-carotene 15,15'-monooxygenase